MAELDISAAISELMARDIGDAIGVDWNEVDIEQFAMGLKEEMEHGSRDPETDVTGDDPLKTGKIALAHLKENPDYYTKLKEAGLTEDGLDVEAGGPGSGCNPEVGKCGRPKGSGSGEVVTAYHGIRSEKGMSAADKLIGILSDGRIRLGESSSGSGERAVYAYPTIGDIAFSHDVMIEFEATPSSHRRIGRLWDENDRSQEYLFDKDIPASQIKHIYIKNDALRTNQFLIYDYPGSHLVRGNKMDVIENLAKKRGIPVDRVEYWDDIKASFNPDQPRVPAGEAGGGQWSDSGDSNSSDDSKPYLENPWAAKMRDEPVYKNNPEYFTQQYGSGMEWYHGTTRDFTDFKVNGIGRGTTDWNSHLGVHFTADSSVAQQFAEGLYSEEKTGGRVITAKLKIANPKEYEFEGDMGDDALKVAFDKNIVTLEDARRVKGADFDPAHMYHDGNGIISALRSKRYRIAVAFKKHLESQGYDGIVYGNVVEGGFGNETAIAFSPEQIKIEKSESIKAAYDPEQPRAPAGGPDGGQWTSDGGGGGGAEKGRFNPNGPQDETFYKNVAKGLFGYDPDKVSVSNEPKTFQLGDRSYKYAGAANLATGEITIWPSEVAVGFEHELMAHEVAHQRFQKVLQAYKDEDKVWMEAAKLQNEQEGIPEDKQVMKRNGDFNHTPENDARFPLVSRFHSIYYATNKADQLTKDDGVTEYSKAWWDAWNQGKTRTDLAMHETVAEIARLTFRNGGKIPDTVKPSWKQYYRGVKDMFEWLKNEPKYSYL